jgi:hypothetical protein
LRIATLAPSFVALAMGVWGAGQRGEE